MQELAHWYHRILRGVILFLGRVAGVGVLAMVVITWTDVVLRLWRVPLAGAYDLAKIAAALTIAAGLPYTSSVKGHVAIEYFFHKLNRRGRIVVDGVVRLPGMALFSVLAWSCLKYGTRLRTSGEVSLTLRLPAFLATVCSGSILRPDGAELIRESP
ncbi:MAG: TRAP transporter small permease [Kiritimatiellia bacterium]